MIDINSTCGFLMQYLKFVIFLYMKKKYFLTIVFIFLFVGCSNSLLYREIEVEIIENHPFEEYCNNKMWYCISYTDGYGDLKYFHLEKGVKRFKLLVKRNKPVFICARAINTFSPLGGFVDRDSSYCILDFESGYFIDFLQNIYLQNPEAINSINYNRLYNLLREKDLLRSFNKLILARDIVNKNLSSSSLYSEANVVVYLDQVMEGYWISENYNEGGFLVSNSNYRRIKLSLSQGYHYYINFEKGYLMNIIVDTKNKKYFIKIEKISMEF